MLKTSLLEFFSVTATRSTYGLLRAVSSLATMDISILQIHHNQLIDVQTITHIYDTSALNLSLKRGAERILSASCL